MIQIKSIQLSWVDVAKAVSKQQTDFHFGAVNVAPAAEECGKAYHWKVSMHFG